MKKIELVRPLGCSETTVHASTSSEWVYAGNNFTVGTVTLRKVVLLFVTDRY